MIFTENGVELIVFASKIHILTDNLTINHADNQIFCLNTLVFLNELDKISNRNLVYLKY